MIIINQIALLSVTYLLENINIVNFIKLYQLLIILTSSSLHTRNGDLSDQKLNLAKENHWIMNQILHKNLLIYYKGPKLINHLVSLLKGSH